MTQIQDSLSAELDALRAPTSDFDMRSLFTA